METSLGWYYRTVLLTSTFGMLAGWLYKRNPDHIFWGLIGGFIVGNIIAFGFLVKYVHKDLFFSFESETKKTVENTHTNRYLDLQLWTDPKTSSWVRLGVTDQEWRVMAETAHKAQVFDTDIIDRAVYKKLRQPFIGLGLLEEKGKGVILTQSGKNLVKLLGDILPYPYDGVPGLIQNLPE